MNMEFKTLKELLTFNIRYYRYKRGYSQEHLAEKCGLSPRYLTDIERGRHCPTIDKIEILAKSLNIKPYELFQNSKRDKEIIDKMNSTRQYNQHL